MPAHLRLYDGAGAFVALLPDLASASCQEELNDTGSWSASYPRNGLNAAQLRDQLDGQVGVVVDGVEVYRGLLEDDGDDSADPHSPLQVSGRGLLAVLERAVVYPAGGAGSTPAEQGYVSATAGTILGDLLTRAQQRRGALPGLTWTFTSGADSAGRAWPQALTVTYAAGVTYLQVLQGLVGQGVCEARMAGTELQLYVPDTELNRDRPDVLLHLGREGRSLPRQRSRRDVASTVLVLGDEGANAERHNATTAATFGRREASLSQGNTTESGTMAVLGDAELARSSRPQLGRTLEYDLAAGGPRPWLDYRVGDRIRLAGVRTAAGELEPLRVRSCAASFDANGLNHPSLELGDLFVEATVRLQRRVEGIVNGTVTTTAAGTATGTAPVEDTTTPSAPATVALSSSAYQDAAGVTYAQATASWTAPTTNDDGTALLDLDSYLVELDDGTGYGPAGTVTTERASWGNLVPGRPLQVRVVAVDRSGNRSAAALSAVVTAGTDATAPPTPSTPTTTSSLGLVSVRWDGRGSAGEAMPADLSHVEVHASTAGATFAPSAATLRDQLQDAGTAPLTGDAYGVQLWVRLVAVDAAGNRSAPSASATGTPSKATSADLGDRIVTEGALAQGAVTAAKTAVAALDPATGDLRADTVTARQILAGAVGVEELAAGSVTTAKLTVGGLSDNLVANGGAEDRTPPAAMPDRWQDNYEGGGGWYHDVGYGVRGASCVTIHNTGALTTAVAAPVFTAVPGEYVEVRAMVRQSVPNPRLYVRVLFSADPAVPRNSLVAEAPLVDTSQLFDLAGNLVQNLGPASFAGAADLCQGHQLPGSGWYQARGRVRVPAGAKYGRVAVYSWGGSTASYDSTDDVSVRRVLGSAAIADASILTARIADLAVTDAKAASLDVGKLTAGTLSAQLTLSGRIATALSGSRVELNSSGLRAYNSAGQETVAVRTDGSVGLVGTLSTGFAGNRVEIGQDRLTFRSSSNGPSPAYLQVRDNTFGSAYGQEVVLDSGRAGTATDRYAQLYLGPGVNGTDGVQLLTSPRAPDSGNVRVQAGRILFLIGGRYGIQLGDYYDYYDDERSTTMSGHLRLAGGYYGRSALRWNNYAGADGAVEEWHRARHTATYPSSAQVDLSVTYPSAFSSRPVVVSSGTYGAATGSNAVVYAQHSGAGGATMRVRDVDGTARTNSINIEMVATR